MAGWSWIQAEPTGPVPRRFASLFARHRLDAEVHHSQILVVDLPEEIEVPRVACANTSQGSEQLASHIVPSRLARASVYVDVADCHKLVVAEIRPAVDLRENIIHQVVADDRIDVHAPSGLSPGRGKHVIATIGQIEPCRPI